MKKYENKHLKNDKKLCSFKRFLASNYEQWWKHFFINAKNKINMTLNFDFFSLAYSISGLIIEWNVGRFLKRKMKEN